MLSASAPVQCAAWDHVYRSPADLPSLLLGAPGNASSRPESAVCYTGAADDPIGRPALSLTAFVLRIGSHFGVGSWFRVHFRYAFGNPGSALQFGGGPVFPAGVRR